MPTHPNEHEPQPAIVELLRQRLSSLSTAALLAIPFQGNLFAKRFAVFAGSLTSDDLLILMNAQTSAINIGDLEREHGAVFICSANFCLTQAGDSFSSDVECEAAEHPDLMRFLALCREDLVAHIARYWAPIVVDVLGTH